MRSKRRNLKAYLGTFFQIHYYYSISTFSLFQHFHHETMSSQSSDTSAATSSLPPPPLLPSDANDEQSESIQTLSASEISAAKRSLWDETGQGLANALMHARSAWHGEEAVFYTRERDRLGSYLPPFYYGMAAATFLFLGFRLAGHSRVQEWQRRSLWNRWWKSTNESKQSVKQATVAKTTSTSYVSTPAQPAPVMGYLETKRIREREQALQSMRVITDFLVSISVGFSGTLFLLEAKRHHMRSDYETAPLVPGRSVVAEHMCPGMLALYQDNLSVQQVLRRNGTSAAALKDHNLTSFAMFLQNCQKRRDVEERIRIEQQRSQHEPVDVPYRWL